MKDLSSAEEDALPLPHYWERVRSINSGDSSGQTVKSYHYRNVSTGLESFEHPYVHEALEAARNMDLPDNWLVKEAVGEDGHTDYYYYNADLGVSLWDPPLFRQCLSDILGSDGHSSAAMWVLTEDVNNLAAVNFDRRDDYNAIEKNYNEDFNVNDKVESAYSRFVNFQNDEQVGDVDDLLEGPVDDNYIDEYGYNGGEYGEDNGYINNEYIQENGNENVDSYNNYSDNVYIENQDDMKSLVSENPSQVSSDATSEFQKNHDEYGVMKKWHSLRESMRKPIDRNERLVHVPHKSRPPRNSAGVKILKADCRSANIRVHELLARLRAGLCAQLGLQSRVIDPFLDDPYDNSSDVENSTVDYKEKDLMRLAADIISKLRKHPERFISMLAKVFKPGDGCMQHASFIIMHRILHPFSADPSITTSLVLLALSFQLQELASISELYNDIDPKFIITRSIFIKDPELAFDWDPLTQPMPVAPNVEHETMFSCLLRLYAIRRDVSSFFRTVWRPSLPAILKTLNDKKVEKRQFFINLVICVCKVLDCTFDEKAIALFPATATAICRTLYEIGGLESMNHYLLNFLLMPNLLKIITGDHNSIENELSFKKDELNAMVNSYFDCNLWWPEKGFSAAVKGDVPTLPVMIGPLYWLLWRIYTGAVFLDMPTIENLTSSGFFAGGPIFDYSGYPDTKLQVLLVRTKRKIMNACKNILALPLDRFGSKFLSEDSTQASEELKAADLQSEQQVNILQESRANALLAKPDEMLTLLIVSRRELAFMFHSAGVDIEIQKKTHKSNLYRNIAEYLMANEYIPEVSDFEYLVIPFNYSDDSELIENDEKLCNLKYDQLLKGLTLADRYEQSLLRLVEIIDNKSVVRLEDMLSDDSQLIAPEFDSNFAMPEKKMHKIHTNASLPKQRRECNFGLKSHDVALEVQQVSDLFVTHVPYIEEYSYRHVFENIHKGLRFGSTSSNASAGTAMFSPGTPKTKAPAHSRFDKPLLSRELNHNNKFITKVEVNPHSRFLSHTEAAESRIDLIQKREDTYRLKDDYVNFKNNLRTYSPSTWSPQTSIQSRSRVAGNSSLMKSADWAYSPGGLNLAQLRIDTAGSPNTPRRSRNPYSPYSKNQSITKLPQRAFKHPEPATFTSPRAQSPTESALHRVVSTDVWFNHDKYVLELRPTDAKAKSGLKIGILGSSRGTSPVESRRDAKGGNHRDHMKDGRETSPNPRVAYSERQAIPQEELSVDSYVSEDRGTISSKSLAEEKSIASHVNGAPVGSDVASANFKSTGLPTSKVLNDDNLKDYVEKDEYYICVFEKGNIIRQGHWLNTQPIQNISKGDVVHSIGSGYVLANGLRTKRLKLLLKGGGFGWCSTTLSRDNQDVLMEPYELAVPCIDDKLRARSASPTKVHIWNTAELIKKLSTEGFIVTKYHNSGGFGKKKVIYDESTGDIVWANVGQRRMSVFGSGAESRMALATIKEVRRGTQTEVFQTDIKAGMGIDPALACSLVNSERSLDVVLETSHDRSLFLRAIAAIMEKNDIHAQIL